MCLDRSKWPSGRLPPGENLCLLGYGHSWRVGLVMPERPRDITGISFSIFVRL